MQAGWYPNPEDSTKMRWWDGECWTGHTQPLPPVANPALADEIFISPPAPISPSPHAVGAAGWGYRVAASILDALIIGLPLYLPGVALVLVGFMGVGGDLIGWLISLALATPYVMGPVINSLLMRRKSHAGQTIGKQLMNIKVVRERGEMTWRWLVFREAVCKGIIFFPPLSLLLSYLDLESGGSLWLVWCLADNLTPLFNSKRKAIHDYLAGSRVIFISPAPAKANS